MFFWDAKVSRRIIVWQRETLPIFTIEESSKWCQDFYFFLFEKFAGSEVRTKEKEHRFYRLNFFSWDPKAWNPSIWPNLRQCPESWPGRKAFLPPSAWDKKLEKRKYSVLTILWTLSLILVLVLIQHTSMGQRDALTLFERQGLGLESDQWASSCRGALNIVCFSLNRANLSADLSEVPVRKCLLQRIRFTFLECTKNMLSLSFFRPVQKLL